MKGGSDLRYDSIIETLLDEFPELTGRYDDEKDIIEGLPHLVFGIIFVGYMLELTKGEGNEAGLRKAFRFVESMLNSPDDLVQELAVVSVLESIEANPHELLKARPYFGKKTSEWFEQYGTRFDETVVT